jgi:magnesium transporter
MSTRTVLRRTEPPFVWLDVVHPTEVELQEIAAEYGLHATSVQDSLDPEHLPKYERIGATTFVIVRAIDTAAGPRASTVQELTRKVAIFFGPGFFITIHRTPQPFLAALEREYTAGDPSPATIGNGELLLPQLLIDLINGAVGTYGAPLEAAENVIDELEGLVFGESEHAVPLRAMYFERRRVALMKRMLRHTLDVIQKLVPAGEQAAPLYQDLRENAESMHVYADELLEDVNNLLGVQIALASHRTNEVVRVLTVFSVFFLPLTFIVGIYGMNFEFMPELRHRLGYPAVWGLMIAVTAAIYTWFRHRGWLRGRG